VIFQLGENENMMIEQEKRYSMDFHVSQTTAKNLVARGATEKALQAFDFNIYYSKLFL